MGLGLGEMGTEKADLSMFESFIRFTVPKFQPLKKNNQNILELFNGPHIDLKVFFNKRVKD